MRNAMLSALRGYIAGMFVLMLCFLHSLYLCSLPCSRYVAGRRAGKGRWLTLTVERCLCECVCVLDKQVEGQRWRWGGVFLERGMGNVFPKTMSFPRDLALTS